MSVKIAKGHCGCGSVRFEVAQQPFAIHACHCSYCQRETGAAFAHNALVEPQALKLVAGEVEMVAIPAQSGNPQRIIRCKKCRTPVWGHYASFGDHACFIRVGAMERPSDFPPDVHIFTASKPDWLTLEGHVPIFQGLYSAKDIPELFGEARALRWWKARNAAHAERVKA